MLHRFHQFVPNTTSLDEAWRMSQADDIRGEFLRTFETEIVRDARWAGWFANLVLRNEWPLAESLIKQDERAWRQYEMHSIIWRCFRARNDPRILTDKYGIITEAPRLKRESLLPMADRPKPLVDVDATAQRVEEFMDGLRRRRAAGDLSEDSEGEDN